MSDRLFVLMADELDELLSGVQLLVYADGEVVCVRRWIFDSYIDVQGAVIKALEALRELAGAGERAALNVEPHVVAKSHGFDYQRVAIPMANRIAIPPGLQVLTGC